MKKFWASLAYTTGHLTGAFLCIAACSAVALYKLGTLTAGLAAQEVAYAQSAENLGLIRDNPSFLPHKLLTFIALHVGQPGAFALRVVSVIFAIVAVCAFFWIIRNLFSIRVAILATTLMGTSAFFLHYARIGLPYILYITFTLLTIAALFWHRFTHRRYLSFLVLVITMACSLYLPGMVYILFALGVWQRKYITQSLQKLSWWMFVLALLAIGVLLVPLIWAFVLNPATMTQAMLGIPPQLAPFTYLKHLALPAISLFIYSTEVPTLGIRGIPVLDILVMALAVLGAYRLFIQSRLLRFWSIIVFVVVSVPLIALNLVPLGILLPVIYLLAAGGIGMLLQQWFMVFPRNPLAKGIGVVLITTVLVLCVFYNLMSYFVAWPHTKAVKQTFTSQNHLNI